MARIRTIKPEFWTDSKIVSLPIEARILFIGLFNFCDDEGYIENDPEQIHLQVLPSDTSVDVDCLLDLLMACGLIDCCYAQTGKTYLHVHNFDKHQKVSHKTPSRIAPEVSGKLQIPAEIRRKVATKYDAKPGETSSASCYYCGKPGRIYWPNTSRGKPGWWVAFSELEIDHLEAESNGGKTEDENLVLACRSCNRKKAAIYGVEFFTKLNNSIESGSVGHNLAPHRRIPEGSGGFQRAPDDSGLKGRELKGIELKGKEGKGKDVCPEPQRASVPTSDEIDHEVMRIPLITKDGEFVVTASYAAELQDSYPGVDVMQSLRACRQWNRDNPGKRKTVKGIRKHVSGWIARDQDSGRCRINGDARMANAGMTKQERIEAKSKAAGERWLAKHSAIEGEYESQ